MRNVITLVCVTLLIVLSSEGVKSLIGPHPSFSSGGSMSFGPRDIREIRNLHTNCVRTSPVQNEAVVRQFYQLAIADKVTDRATLSQLVAVDYIQHNPLAADGLQGMINALNGPLQAIPNFVVKFRHVIAAGDYVVTHLPLPFGTDVFAVMDIFRFECGKIKEHWDSLQNTTGVVSLNSHPFF